MAKEKVDKGTHYEAPKKQQKSYFLKYPLGDVFRDFNLGNASTAAAGAFVLWLSCEEFPALREAAIHAAENLPIAAAKEKISHMLLEEVGFKAMREWAKSLPEAERAKILAEYQKKKQKGS